ncbi:uncharacterized protein I206_104488 [Kwoniella pini CBS 10737]|uniref:Uncharacterized protein n=1 Tax=Kwoniella pini CBS 10737 TaxID=1296096 RepID=A0A1B9I6Y2_9TREE|nr:uncharacterized protein I206_02019 [Kwoniella pini CBS 10737]OCF51305.1 hypothetical protein I206_02019 [Kwoniella pini CBS 10737]
MRVNSNNLSNASNMSNITHPESDTLHSEGIITNSETPIDSSDDGHEGYQADLGQQTPSSYGSSIPNSRRSSVTLVNDARLPDQMIIDLDPVVSHDPSGTTLISETTNPSIHEENPIESGYSADKNGEEQLAVEVTFENTNVEDNGGIQYNEENSRKSTVASGIVRHRDPQCHDDATQLNLGSKQSTAQRRLIGKLIKKQRQLQESYPGTTTHVNDGDEDAHESSDEESDEDEEPDGEKKENKSPIGTVKYDDVKSSNQGLQINWSDKVNPETNTSYSAMVCEGKAMQFNGDITEDMGSFW